MFLLDREKGELVAKAFDITQAPAAKEAQAPTAKESPAKVVLSLSFFLLC
jgi:hypothetical protein